MIMKTEKKSIGLKLTDHENQGICLEKSMASDRYAAEKLLGRAQVTRQWCVRARGLKIPREPNTVEEFKSSLEQ